MTINKLIEKLQAYEKTYGNIIVESRNPAGDFDDICEVQVVNVSRNADWFDTEYMLIAKKSLTNSWQESSF